MNTYRKTRDGTWVVFGPSSDVKVGQVTVTKKNGDTKIETVERVSRPFDVDGVAHVYGFVAQRARQYSSRGSSRRENDPENGWKYNGCSDCRRKRGWCDRCYFDEFDC